MICRTPLLVNAPTDPAKDIEDYGSIVTALVKNYDDNRVKTALSEGKDNDIAKSAIGQEN